MLSAWCLFLSCADGAGCWSGMAAPGWQTLGCCAPPVVRAGWFLPRSLPGLTPPTFWVVGTCLATRMSFSFLFFNIFYWLCYYSCPIFPLYSLPPYTPLPSTFPPLTSCPWVIHIGSLASPFPILSLTSPCLFCTCHLCCLFLYLFPHSHPPTSLLVTLHVISLSVILFLF